MTIEDDRVHLARLIKRRTYPQRRGFPPALLADLTERIDALTARINEQETT